MFNDYDCNEQTFHPLHRFAMGRRRGGPGFGGFTGGFAHDLGMGGGPFRFGRKFASGDLQLLILALLAEKPRHGYELIKAFEEHSGGFYSPSPGMIYPALAYLEEVGHATAEAEGTKKLYHVTDSGRVHLEAHRASVDRVWQQLQRIGERMERLRGVFSGDDQEAGGEDIFSGHPSRETRSREMKDARHALKAALHQKRPSSSDESKRIAAILQRAAAEILERG